MVLKKSDKDSNSNFRQQDSTARKLERNFDTAEKKQIAQTESVVDGSQKQSQGKLQKQFTNQNNHSTNEFRQQDSTARKIERTIDTAEQQQFAQTKSVLNNNSSSDSPFTQGNLAQPTSSVESSANKSRLQRQNHNRVREEFRQQESTANKIDKTLETAGQQQFAHSAKATSESVSSSGKLQHSKSSATRRRYKLVAQELGKGALTTTKNSLQKGVKSYQKQLEQDDEGVRLASQSVQKGVTAGKKVIEYRSKLKKKKLEKDSFVKAKQDPLSKEKKKVSSLRKIANAPSIALKKGVKSGAMQYKGQLEQDDEGVRLASQGSTQIVRASKKLSKGIGKINSQSGKLGRQNSRLRNVRFAKGKKMKVESTKAALQKRAIRKRMYAPQRAKSRAKVFTGAMSSISGRLSAMFKSLGKINLNTIRNAIGAKLAYYAGAGLMSIMPYIAGLVVILLLLAAIMGGGGTQQQVQIGNAHNISPEVAQWRSLVEAEAAAQGMEDYVGLILAIIQVESGGTGTRDIMQSSESAGYPRNYWSTEEESVRQGIKYLKSIVDILRGFNNGYESNSKLLAQAYNFGSAFAGYVGRQGGEYSLDVAERYSREVVAPSLGNVTGITYPYVNTVSQSLGKTYLYRNGGNFMYGDLVAQYIGGGSHHIDGDFRIVVDELEKYLGWSYVWGGKSPSTGFDCSGFVSWGLAQIGINLPSYAAAQYDLTVPIDPSEARPGDLIFFRGTYGGPNHVSHVGFYIDDTTMLDSNGSGVGYHNWKDAYWSRHYAGIRRVVR